jgi:hypothetical protein
VSENVKAGAWKLSAEERDAVDKLRSAESATA